MHRRRSFVLSMLLAIACPAAWSASPEVPRPLVVAISQSTPPFSYQDTNGRLVGFNVDIAQLLCKHLRRPCRFDVMPFQDILPSIAAGRADVGLGNFLRTPEREQQVRFSRPYWRSTSSFVGPRTLRLPSLAQLTAQHSICATRGSKQFGFLQALASDRPAAVVAASSNQEVFAHLVDKRCTLALAPTLQGLNFLQSAAGAGHGFIGAPLTQDGLGGDVHIIARPDAPELLIGIDKSLADSIADGTHKRLMRKYFPFDIL